MDLIGRSSCILSYHYIYLLNGLGVDSGDTIRVPGAGNGGRGSQPGNLFIKLKAWFYLFII